MQLLLHMQEYPSHSKVAWLFNTTSFLILNGRFETADGPIHCTLQRQDEATINNYNLIAKQHFLKVKTMLRDT